MYATKLLGVHFSLHDAAGFTPGTPGRLAADTDGRCASASFVGNACDSTLHPWYGARGWEVRRLLCAGYLSHAHGRSGQSVSRWGERRRRQQSNLLCFTLSCASVLSAAPEKICSTWCSVFVSEANLSCRVSWYPSTGTCEFFRSWIAVQHATDLRVCGWCLDFSSLCCSFFMGLASRICCTSCGIRGGGSSLLVNCLLLQADCDR